VGAQTILHVDRSAAAAGDGSSWASPLTSLADALAQATAGDTVRVDQDTYSTAGGFAIPAGVTVRGSFTASTAQPTERDLSPGQKTVLSGDVDGDGTGDGRVVTVQNAADASVPTTLDGFILTKGAGAGIGDEAGGTALRTQGAGASVVSRVEVLANTSGFSVLQITGQTDVLSSVVANNTSDGPPVVAREWSGTMDRVTAADNAGPTDVRGVNSTSGTIQNSLFDGENRIDTRTEAPIAIDGVTHEIGGDLFAGGYDGQLSRLEIDNGGTTYTVPLGSNPTQNAFSQSILPVGSTVAFRLYDSQGTQVGEASANPEFERPVSAHDNMLDLTDQDEMPERPYHQSFGGVVTMPVSDAQQLEQLRVLPYELPVNTFNGET
jgi:hypothetical protein